MRTLELSKRGLSAPSKPRFFNRNNGLAYATTSFLRHLDTYHYTHTQEKIQTKKVIHI